MTTLTPILYADGALRLTDHGPQGGGLILVHVPSRRQIAIPEGCLAANYIAQDLTHGSPGYAFELACETVAHWQRAERLAAELRPAHRD